MQRNIGIIPVLFERKQNMTDSSKRRKSWTIAVVAVAVASATPPAGTANAWEMGAPIVTYFSDAMWPQLYFREGLGQEIVDGGYNLVDIGSIYPTREIDNATSWRQTHGAGLRFQFKNPLISAASLDDPAKLASLNDLIDQFQACPGAYSYFIAGEPNASDFSSLKRISDHICARDPNHLTYINLYPNNAGSNRLGTSTYAQHLSQYINKLNPQLLSYDHYVFRASAGTPYDQSEYFHNLAQIRSTAQAAGIPFMNVIQNCNWDSSHSRVPTNNQLRYQATTSLAYGASAISWFNVVGSPGNGGVFDSDTFSPTPTYWAIAPINREFQANAMQLQQQTSIGAYHLGDQPPGTMRGLPVDSPFSITPTVTNTNYATNQPVKGMLIGLFGPNAQVADAEYAYVVNLDHYNSVTTTISGPEDLSMFYADSGVWTSEGRSYATLTLGPGDGILVGLSSVIIPEPRSMTLSLTGMHGLVVVSAWKRKSWRKLKCYTRPRNASGTKRSLPL
jgi:hypothetical protein